MKLFTLITISFLIFLALSLNAQERKIDMHGGKDTKMPSTMTSKKEQIFHGKVLEIKSAAPYLYLKVDEGGQKIWIAIANAPVKVGDKIGYDKQTVMTNFKSKTLKQDFDRVYFASDVYLPQNNTGSKSMKEMLGIGASSKKLVKVTDTVSFEKKDRHTVEEVFIWRKELKDQNIMLEGKVSKISHGIMSLDWIHLGDGTGDEKQGTHDLIFTATDTTIKVGDTVIAKGTVTVDKDFGFGYFYPVIIQNSSFKVK